MLIKLISCPKCGFKSNMENNYSDIITCCRCKAKYWATTKNNKILTCFGNYKIK